MRLLRNLFFSINKIGYLSLSVHIDSHHFNCCVDRSYVANFPLLCCKYEDIASVPGCFFLMALLQSGGETGMGLSSTMRMLWTYMLEALWLSDKSDLEVIFFQFY